MSLLGKVAIVTGGGSGIGEAVSQELARRGATVVVADINSGDASRVAEAIGRSGGRAEARQVDVSGEDVVRQMVGETAASHGRLDYLFNNAGIGIEGDARDLTSEHWRRVLGVDLFGVIYGTLAAYPIMTRQGFGHIVNTSSAAGLLPGVLEQAGLITRRKQGREVLYHVQAGRLDQATRAMADLAPQWDRRLTTITRLAEAAHAENRKRQT